MTTDPTNEDDSAVAELLGRAPAGRYAVVVRDTNGGPVVIRNAPLLDDGTPMPTRYWLVGRDEVAAVSRLEAAGGVRAAEAAVDADELAEAHARYAAERDAEVPADAPHRPTGGVGGTRTGVKCLHAHYAWYLAGGDDPIGRWVAARLGERLRLDITRSAIVLHNDAGTTALATAPDELTAELGGSDPPGPQDLTNALGAVTDELDDVVRARPEIASARTLEVAGGEAWHLAVVERGADPGGDTTELVVERGDLEDLFRTLATERRADRLHNPGLDPSRVDSVLAACCTVLAIMRRLQLDSATFVARMPSTIGGVR